MFKGGTAVLTTRLHYTIRRSAALLLAVFFALLPSISASEEPIPVLIYDRPPYYVRQIDGTFAGLVGAPVAQAFERAGIPFVWTTALFHTHLAEIRSDRHPVCAAGWFKTEEREDYGGEGQNVESDGEHGPEPVEASHDFAYG